MLEQIYADRKLGIVERASCAEYVQTTACNREALPPEIYYWKQKDP